MKATEENNNIDLRLTTDRGFTKLCVNEEMQHNEGCKRQYGQFKSANVYRNKKSPNWYTCKYSKSVNPANVMTKEELKYWDFIGIARYN